MSRARDGGERGLELVQQFAQCRELREGVAEILAEWLRGGRCMLRRGQKAEMRACRFLAALPKQALQLQKDGLIPRLLRFEHGIQLRRLLHLAPLHLQLLRRNKILIALHLQILIMLQPHPSRQIALFLVPDRQDIPQRVDLELVKVLVHDCVQQTLELDDARVDFGLLEGEEGVGAGFVGWVGVGGEAETEGFGRGVAEAGFDGVDGAEDELVDRVYDVVQEGLGCISGCGQGRWKLRRTSGVYRKCSVSTAVVSWFVAAIVSAMRWCAGGVVKAGALPVGARGGRPRTRLGKQTPRLRFGLACLHDDSLDFSITLSLKSILFATHSAHVNFAYCSGIMFWPYP